VVLEYRLFSPPLCGKYYTSSQHFSTEKWVFFLLWLCYKFKQVFYLNMYGWLKQMFYYYYSFIHICIHCLCHFYILPPPLPFSSPFFPPPSKQNLFCSFLQFRWRVKISNNKKDIAFLLVEIRTAIQRFLALLSCTNVLQPRLIHL
jgi:hypothetical protein